MKLFGVLILSLSLWSVSASADSPKDFASWWIKNYGVVDATMDPLVSRAEKVFERVSAAADKKGNRFPRFLIIRGEGDPYALVIRDGTVLLTHGGLKTCYRGVSPEKGDSRLAFVLGHELAHLAKDDFWHSSAFAAVREFGDDQKVKTELMRQLKWDPADPKTREFIKKQELQADAYGLIYMTMAGYDPKAIVEKDKTNFFEDWVSQITGKVAYGDTTHPGPLERAEFLRAQLWSVVDALNYFQFGVRLYQLGRFADSLLLLEAFRERFPSREVFNNIGLCHYQLAMKALFSCDEALVLRFKLPAILDTESLGTKLRASQKEPLYCLKNRTFLKHIEEATRHLQRATEMDPTYLPAKINLSSVWIMLEEYPKALGVVDEVLRVDPHHPEAMSNKALALYLFGKANNIETADQAIGILQEVLKKNPLFTDAIYNIGFILSDRGRKAASEEFFRRFLKSEPTGIYAQAARQRLGIKNEPPKTAEKRSEMRPPIMLGEIKGESERQLRGMKQKPFSVGPFRGVIYEGPHLKVLAIDHTIEVVEKELEAPLTSKDFFKNHGEPLRKLKGLLGTTLIYNNFGVDVVDGKIEKVLYFKGETI
ncbi:MAG: tetratricopeptide repeat protein [Desulfobacterota bacterium]|nr:tetratricopeptide repeat protein [Thermodesulfobacteriota bacterium]